MLAPQGGDPGHAPVAVRRPLGRTLAAGSDAGNSISRRFCAISLAFLLLWVVFLTWQPFQPDLRPDQIRERLTEAAFALRPNLPLMRALSMAAIGCLLGLASRWPRWLQVLLMGLLCFGLELSQTLFENRHARAGDLLTALVSGTLGVLLAPRLRAVLLRDAGWRRLAQLSRPLAVLFLLVCGWCAYGGYASVSLVDWDPRYPLRVAEAAAGQPPWTGCLTAVAVFAGSDRAPIVAEVPMAASGGPPACLPAGQVMAPDVTPALVAAARTTRAFRVALDLQDYDALLRRTSDIVTMSQGRYRQNFAVAQNWDNVLLRVRTPVNGRAGEFNVALWRDVFADAQPHRIVVAFSEGVATLAVDDGPPVAPHHVQNVSADPVDTIGLSIGWLVLLVLVPLGVYGEWGWNPAHRPGPRWIAGAVAGAVAAVAGWAGARLFAVPFDPLPAAAAMAAVPLAAWMAGRQVRRSANDTGCGRLA